LIIRILLLLFAALIAAPSAALTGSRLVGGSVKTPIPQLAAFAPWAVIGWSVVLLALLIGRWWWIAVLSAVLLVLQTSWVLPPRGSGAARASTTKGSVGVKVMTINVKVGSADIEQVLALAQKHGVDLLAVEEAQPPLVERLNAGLKAELPYVVQSNPNWASGTVIWSRWPISRLGPALGIGGEISRVRLLVPGAVPVTLTGVHTISPGRGRIDGWNRDLKTLADASRGTSGAQVLLGDFNAGADHAPFRRLLGTGLVDSADAVRMSPWSGATWPTDLPHVPPAVRIDHVLVTPGTISVQKVRTATVDGTDHRAVLADLAFEAAS
jgi:endonuclease/exonuclease/phosphatase (EEP) superfamily protein YafD